MGRPDQCVIIDTNLWVSMAIGSRSVTHSMLRIINDPFVEVCISIELLEELTETLAKPRLIKYLTKERTQQLFELIWLKARLIQVNTSVHICRDSKDDFIINLAIEAGADYIITGDKDLLILNPLEKIQICTLTDFFSD